jgi:hypothetical protein
VWLWGIDLLTLLGQTTLFNVIIFDFSAVAIFIYPSLACKSSKHSSGNKAFMNLLASILSVSIS